jgi:glycosyltransferase involved in cell wall biosynthesis
MFTPEAKQPFVFAAGRLWDQAKNLGTLDRVAKELEWPVYVAGESQHPAGGEHQRFKHCRTLGPLPAEDVAGWLRRASIYAFPAKYEPFGLSVLEAALAGCTLVLSDLPTLRELWDGAAVFVSPDEQPTLRLAIQSLIEDSGLRNALAMRARRRASELTPQRMARAYLEVYTGLLAGGHRRAEEPACAS